MRLSKQEQIAIYEAIRRSLENNDFRLFLYGSRTDKSLKGGDIDLIVMVADEWKHIIKMKDYELLTEIKNDKIIGDRRIDLKIISPKDLTSDSFVKSIAQNWKEIISPGN